MKKLSLLSTFVLSCLTVATVEAAEYGKCMITPGDNNRTIRMELQDAEDLDPLGKEIHCTIQSTQKKVTLHSNSDLVPDSVQSGAYSYDEDGTLTLAIKASQAAGEDPIQTYFVVPSKFYPWADAMKCKLSSETKFYIQYASEADALPTTYWEMDSDN